MHHEHNTFRHVYTIGLTLEEYGTGTGTRSEHTGAVPLHCEDNPSSVWARCVGSVHEEVCLKWKKLNAITSNRRLARFDGKVLAVNLGGGGRVLGGGQAGDRWGLWNGLGGRGVRQVLCEDN